MIECRWRWYNVSVWERSIFGGRLGNYKYYDMDKVIEAALETAEKELA